MFRSSQGGVKALWFYEDKSADEIAVVLEKLVKHSLAAAAGGTGDFQKKFGLSAVHVLTANAEHKRPHRLLDRVRPQRKRARGRHPRL